MSVVGGSGGEAFFDGRGTQRGSRGTRARTSPDDPFEPPQRSGLGRGVAIVVGAVILAALLLPSATRAPLSVVSSSRTTTGTSASSSTIASRTTTTGASGRSTSTTAPAPKPSTIHVLVANATTVNGIAGAVTSFLANKGFATLTATNATTRLTATQVFYTTAGSAAEATEVAGALSLAPTTVQAASAVPPVASTGGASVVVVAGQDLATRFSSSATTTTAPPATTTTRSH